MADPYSGLTFGYDDFVGDVEAIQELAADFLEDQGRGALTVFVKQLANTRNARVSQRLSIGIGLSDHERLQTRVSEGRYHATEKGEAVPVYGTLSCEWEIEHRDAGRSKQEWFYLVGVATTHLRVCRAENHEPIAQWQSEIGDAKSPGCHFHSGMKQRDDRLAYSDTPPFPHWLEVPRLPGFCITPMDALDFLLGELFQKEWWERVCKQSDKQRRWGRNQSHRLKGLINWQLSQVVNWKGTPWMTLKRAKPPGNLLQPDN